MPERVRWHGHRGVSGATMSCRNHLGYRGWNLRVEKDWGRSEGSCGLKRRGDSRILKLRSPILEYSGICLDRTF